MAENRLGEKLRELRGDRPQADVAKAIGLGRARYGHIETGRVPWPNVEIFNALARTLEVPVNVLLKAAGASIPDDPEGELAWIIQQLQQNGGLEVFAEIGHGVLRGQLRRPRRT
jgi:transcriptional regulator with XRE-family HTH domain